LQQTPFEGDAMKTHLPKQAAPVQEKSPLFEALKKSGLIGCVSGPGDAARNHSLYLKGKPNARKKKAA
jgi:hypothetical protein